MQIIPHGAAQEVTGTCHELAFTGPDGHPRRVLLDCGLFQGHRQEAAQKNFSFTFDPKTDIDAVVLSHAHMDHAGRIPVLWKRGFRGKVHCTYATVDLAAVMLSDGGYVQEQDEEFFCKYLSKSMVKCDGPLYSQHDAQSCMELFTGHNYSEWFEVVPGMRVQFFDAGHILGAAMLVIEVTENGKTHRIGFSGDLGRSHLPIIRDPSSLPAVDTLICESTYGNRMHTPITEARTQLKAVVTETARRGGKILIPAFSLERTQEIVYDLHVLHDAGEIPPIPIIIDSPLASKVTEVFMKHPECYDENMAKDFLSKQHNPFQFSLVRYTDSVEESKALNTTPGPMIIMAGSGMCEAGRIRHHLKNELEDERNAVVAVGFMAADTLGARIVDPSLTEVKIFDAFVHKRAHITYIDAYSGHADMSDLDTWVGAIDGVKKVILVHGELAQMQPFASRIGAMKPGCTVLTPAREEVITVE